MQVLGTPARFPGARLLYVLPHADDELFAAGLLFANAGLPQTLVWLTHGGLLPRLRAAERRRMATMLRARLGVACYSLELPDGGLDAQHERAGALLEGLAAGPTVVVTTDPEGEHGDHDAAFALCERLARGRRLVTVPCYDRGWRWGRRVGVPRANGPPPEAPARGSAAWYQQRMGKRLARLRLRLALGYPSQWVFLLPMLASGGARFLTTQCWRDALAGF
ncbi:MAG TPA: PIG-L family deacetylase [Thermoanaerobaculia bacterium]|nr:PIG-L family deacetylase [Thermoanaerobaculia bacterium]